MFLTRSAGGSARVISLMNGSRQGNRRVKSSIVSPVYISIQNLFKIFFQTFFLNSLKFSQVFEILGFFFKNQKFLKIGTMTKGLNKITRDLTEKVFDEIIFPNCIISR